MNTINKIELLRKEASANKASNDVLCVLASRERARSNLNLTSLYNRMKKENFNHQRDAYIPILKLLSDLGFGELDVTRTGRVKGLKNIQVNLISIGRAAQNGQNILKTYRKRNKFANFIVDKPKVIEKAPVKAQEIKLPININGRIVYVHIPADLPREDIADIIEKLSLALY